MIRITISLLFILITLITFSQEGEQRGYIVKVGDKAPDFTATLTDGSQVSLHDLKGKIIMLQFTASWCKVCRQEMPIIEEEIWQKQKNNGLLLIGIDRDEPLETVIAFGEKMKITYPLALDPGAEIFSLFAHKKSGVTRNVIIDKDGNIAFLTRLFNKEEFNEMKSVINQLLSS
jgi:peroxiredoxin